MKDRIRITPLNMLSAALLLWIGWQWTDGTLAPGTGFWLSLLLITVVAADLFFRFMLRSLKRIWLAEAFFAAFVILVIFILN